METNEKRILARMNWLYSELIARKPGDRSPLDRVYAVATTDVEKLLAYWVMFAGAEKLAIEGEEE